MRCFIISIALFVAATIAVPLAVPGTPTPDIPAITKPDDGNWHEGKKWTPTKYDQHHKRADDGSWYAGKYEGHGTPYDNGMYKHNKRDDGSWWAGKYEGAGTKYSDDSKRWCHRSAGECEDDQ
ncbi:hypothetical protein FPQ18DRAFT_305115 [Pyronema domesticum]|nr:hypothetical protein FPQ18DRAFT_305115 [Pyronema domesticum]